MHKLRYTIEHLLLNSKLPGPRSNLELLYEFIQHANRDEVLKCLNINYVTTNSPEEFVLSCGVGASIYLDTADHVEIGMDLKYYANHESWRVREAVCIGFQKSKEHLKPDEMLAYLAPLKAGTELEIRTYIATLGEPILLKNYIDPNGLLQFLYDTTITYFDHQNKLNESQKVLKKALGYCWSVVLCGENADRSIFEKLIAYKDNKHIKWIIVENLKKNRLEKLDSDWVKTFRLNS